MRIKHKVLGLFAVVGLSLSLISGAAESIDGFVDLLHGDCAVAVGENSAFNFGVWKWDSASNSYQLDPDVPDNSAESSISFTLYFQSPVGGKCLVGVTTTGLFLKGEANSAPIMDFQDRMNNGEWLGINTVYRRADGFSTNSPSWLILNEIRLISVPNTHAPGAYTGTFEFTVVNDPAP